MTKVLVVAGTHSGCGKTLTALGLMAALTQRGLKVQPFKAGPDFIDPSHHALVCGRPSHNLDGWMLGREGVRDVFHRYARDADVAVVEGVMGLYDGASATDETGSTAELAKWLGAPVLLVADARSLARSAGALVHGYTTFDPDLDFLGVAFNRTGSDNHRDILSEVVANACPDVPLLGCLARDESLAMPSRHLGLVTAQDRPVTRQTITALADWLEAGVDIPALGRALPEVDWAAWEEPASAGPATPLEPGEPPVRIGVAMDRAFCFYYLENLRHLMEAGAEIVFFSPLEEAGLPEALDGLYLGGGYPELHAEALSANRPMLDAVRDFSFSGRPVYAECGGFMYLMRDIATMDGVFPMAGVFGMGCRMGERFRALGYREAVTTTPSLLGEPWTVLRGHEFHYSEPLEIDEDAACIYKLQDRKGWMLQKEGFQRRNTLGTYIHAHFGSNPGAAASFVAACAARRT